MKVSTLFHVATVLRAKSESDVMFWLQIYQGLRIDITCVLITSDLSIHIS